MQLFISIVSVVISPQFQAEIDEYQNYDSALNALREAHKSLSRTSEHSVKALTLVRKMELLNKFILVLTEGGPQAVVELGGFFNSPDMELGIIKAGNVYSAVIDIQMKAQAYSQALETMNLMLSSGTNIERFVNREKILHICKNLNVPSKPYIPLGEAD